MNTKILFLSIGILLLSLNTSFSQEDYNLSFEKVADGKPYQWNLSSERIGASGYLLEIEDGITSHGNFSLKLQYDSTENNHTFGAASVVIPAKYEGQQITLKGKIKTENVQEGYAGLWLRIDGKGRTMQFDNMRDRGIQGTKEWDEYTIQLPLDKNAEKIFVGGLLTGKGTMWMDDLVVTIDGEPLDQAPAKEIIIPPAAQDTVFADGSGISIADYNEETYQRLYDLCKIWGYVKYYHPQVAAGNHNMDAELFRVLARVIESENHYSTITQWIKGLGGDLARSESGYITDKEVKLEAPVNWLDGIPDDQLRNLLINIYEAERPEDHYYISLVPNIANPSFDNEDPYPIMDYTDDGMRLLSLFRYWNMIQYWFPYRHIMDRDWDEVLKEFIPRFLVQEEEYTYKLDVLQLIGRIQDTHANIWSIDPTINDFWGKWIAPLELSYVEDQWIVTRKFDLPDVEMGIGVGDVITHIDGRDIMDITEEKIKYCPASNRPTQLRDLGRKLLRTDNDELNLSIKKGAHSKEVTVKTVDQMKVNFWQKDISSHRFLSEDVGYIYPASLNRGEIDTIMEKMMETKGIVLDLRCYPSDFIVFSMGKYLMPAPNPFVKFTYGDIQMPGRFLMGDPLSNGMERDDYFIGKLAILINETTQSQAEYTTMALRGAPQGKVFGSTTAAADGNVSAIYLPGNIRTMISGIGVYYPDGRETQRIGIIPDVEVKPTVKGIQKGIDEVLESAINWIKS